MELSQQESLADQPTQHIAACHVRFVKIKEHTTVLKRGASVHFVLARSLPPAC